MAPLLGALLPVLGEIGSTVARSLFPDPADQQKRDQATQQFQLEIMRQAQVMEKAAADVVLAEAASQHWLAANWRPITMLIFVGLIVARWFGWAAPNLGPEEYLKLWDIVQLGLGGYVIGRSVEKVVPSIAASMKKN